MSNNLQLKRGLQSALPIGLSGELLFTTDTKRLYVSDGSANNLLQGSDSIFTTGSIPFSNSSGKLTTDSSNFYWDDTNNRLGIGTATPQARLDVRAQGALSTDIALRVRNSADTTNLLSIAGNGNSVINGSLRIVSLPSVGNVIRPDEVGVAFQFGNGNNTSYGEFRFKDAGGTDIGRLLANGNLLINTTTDAGYRLDVNGTARVQGNSFQVTDGGTNRISITSNQISCLAGVSIANLNVVAGAISMPNSTLGIGIAITGGTTSTLVIGSGNATNSSGTITIGQSSRGFAPTSGTATFSFLTWDGTINQTGGANGITRGLYINPTLTSAADFRAIHTTRGKIVFENLPTSATGLPTGAIWNDSGTLKIV